MFVLSIPHFCSSSAPLQSAVPSHTLFDGKQISISPDLQIKSGAMQAKRGEKEVLVIS